MKKSKETAVLEKRVDKIETFVKKQEDINQKTINMLEKMKDENKSLALKMELALGKLEILEKYLSRIVLVILGSIVVQFLLKSGLF